VGLHGRDLADGGARVDRRALFLLIGLLYERTHSREVADYGRWCG
jgi:hypothetical protein